MLEFPVPMKFLRLGLIRRFLISATAIIAGLVVLCWWAAKQIASPPRRPLQDYHREFIDSPGSHGLRIDSFTAGDGTPCLVCSPSGEPAHRGLAIRNQMTVRGQRLPRFGEIHGNLVLTHGRLGRKEDYLPIAERLCACGFRCVIPDLPAHGEHPAKNATYGIRESSIPARILSDAATAFSFDQQPAGLLGLSMGGSVAVHAASLPEARWKALVVIASFDSFRPAVDNQVSGYVGKWFANPVSRATGAFYQQQTGVSLDSIQPWRRVSTLHIPTLVAHGTADPVIPLANGRHLFDSLPAATTKKWVEIPGADHNRVLVTDFPIFAEISEWMLRHVR